MLFLQDVRSRLWWNLLKCITKCSLIHHCLATSVYFLWSNLKKWLSGKRFGSSSLFERPVFHSKIWTHPRKTKSVILLSSLLWFCKAHESTKLDEIRLILNGLGLWCNKCINVYSYSPSHLITPRHVIPSSSDNNCGENKTISPKDGNLVTQTRVEALIQWFVVSE